MKTAEEFKGTKGNWSISFSHIGKKCAYAINEFTGNANEDVANAHLIAAAPELLEALQETDKDLCVLEGNMAQIEKSDPRADGMTTLVSEWRKRNRKAINKALGL